MTNVLEFIFSDVWHFLGIVVMMLIISTWRFVNVDVTVIDSAGIKELKKNGDSYDR